MSHKHTCIENHYAIKIISKELDLKHNCGYITMMRISQSPVHKMTANVSIAKKSQEDSSKHLIKPVNNKNSENKRFSNELAFVFPDDNGIRSETGPFQENDWLLLDCSFGIPLFDGNLNKKVCERLLDEKLCNTSRFV